MQIRLPSAYHPFTLHLELQSPYGFHLSDGRPTGEDRNGPLGGRGDLATGIFLHASESSQRIR